MRIDSLHLHKFRNFENASIDTNEKNIFFVGENGQGKSNLLEAIYYCCYASSFRGASDRVIAKNGGSVFSASLRFPDALTEKVTVKFENQKKSILINDKKITDRKQLLYVVPCIIFCHEDMSFVNGTQEQRRWFFDQNLCLFDALYLDDLRRYKSLVKSKNTVLRKLKESGDYYFIAPADKTLLDTLDEQIAETGINLIKKRAAEIDTFSAVFSEYYETVSGLKNVFVSYQKSWKGDIGGADDKEGIYNEIVKRRERDIFMGACGTGPHRERYTFMYDDRDFLTQASTGQQRLAALLLRICQ